MPRPKSKDELIAKSNENFQKLQDLISGLPREKQESDFPSGTLNRNIRDVLTHLHHWHLMFMNWYDVGMKGEKPDMPAKGYTWQTLPELNKWIWGDYQKTSLAEAHKLFNNSHNEIQKLINKHSDEELFEKKRFAWTGSTSLGSYLVSTACSHYEWAMKLIKKATK